MAHKAHDLDLSATVTTLRGRTAEEVVKGF